MAALGINFVFTALYGCAWLCSMFAISSQQRTSNTQCDEHTNYTGYRIDPNARDLILEIHNRRRVSTANAEYRNGRNSFHIRYAKNMMEMKYDCDLETRAHEIASACPQTETPQTTLTDQGENFLEINKQYSQIGTASNALNIVSLCFDCRAFDKQAGTKWFEEILHNGINQHLVFTRFFSNKKPTVYHWSQMVWANTWKIGCEIGDCYNSYTIVVCRYSPKGNVINEKVYKPGRKMTCEKSQDPSFYNLCAYPVSG